MDRLFEPDSFRSAADSGREPRVGSRRRGRYDIPPGVETPGEGWFLISTTLGPIPDIHQVAGTMADGSVVTTCSQVGRVIQAVPVGTSAYICEACKGTRP